MWDQPGADPIADIRDMLMQATDLHHSKILVVSHTLWDILGPDLREQTEKRLGVEIVLAKV